MKRFCLVVGIVASASRIESALNICVNMAILKGYVGYVKCKVGTVNLIVTCIVNTSSPRVSVLPIPRPGNGKSVGHFVVADQN